MSAVTGGGPRWAQLEAQLGDFLVEDEIARSSLASVHRIRVGRHPDRRLALKLGLVPIEGEELERYRHEIHLLSELRHPNVVGVYDFGVLPGGFPFLTMELLADVDVKRVVQDGDWDLFYSLAMDAASGLGHIHRHDIVHRDVKPGNLGLVETEAGWRLKILDFGLADTVRGRSDLLIRGTLAYTAPEVLQQDSVDHRADLYSLGMSLFHMATGVLPSAGSDQQAIRFHLEGDVPDPQAYRADMPTRMASIVRRLLARDPAERPASAGQLLAELADVAGRSVDSVLGATAERDLGTTELIGRVVLVDELVERVARLDEEAGGLVVLAGPQGVGRSRLLREIRLRASLQGARVGWGDGAEGERSLAGAVFSALANLGVSVADGRDREGPIVEATGAVVEAARRDGGPLVLLLDDIDPDDVDGLDDLHRSVVDERVLVVASVRGETSWAEVMPGREVVDLRPLDPLEVRGLVEASLGAGALPDGLHEWIVARAGGRPRRVFELLRELIDERVLRLRHGEWKPSLTALAKLERRTDAFVEGEFTVPADPDARRVLEALSVVTEPVEVADLSAVTSLDDEQVVVILSGLDASGPATPGRGESAGVTVGPGVRAAVSRGLDTEERAEWHRAWAERFGDRLGSDDDPDSRERIADHYCQAGEFEAALPHLEARADGARRAFEYRAAAREYGRVAVAAEAVGREDAILDARLREAECLEAAGSTFRALALYRSLLGRVPSSDAPDDRRRRVLLWIAAARLYGRLGEPSEQLAAAGEGLRLLEDGDDIAWSVELHGMEADALFESGFRSESLATARRSLKAATREGLVRQRVQLLDLLGRILRSAGEVRKAEFLLRRALRASVELEDERLQASLSGRLAEIVWSRGEWREARSLWESGLESARRMRDPWTEMSSQRDIAHLEAERGEWKGARHSLMGCLDARRRLGAREGEDADWLLMGRCEEMLGDWERAQRHYRRVRDSAAAAGRGLTVAATAWLASIARKRGDWSRAEMLGREALSAAERLGEHDRLWLAHLQLGLVEKDREHTAPAAAHLGRALEIAGATGRPGAEVGPRVALADLDLRLGNPDESADHLTIARSLAEDQENRFVGAQLDSVAARLAAGSRDTARADELFGRAVAVFEELEVPFEYARTLYEWGVRTASPEIALERLDRALVAFERLGAATDFERTRGVIEAIRERHEIGVQGGRTPPGIWEVARVINTTLDLDEVLERTMDLVLERLGAERGMIVLANPLTAELEVATSRNFGEGGREGLELSETVVRRVIDESEPVLAIDALVDPRFAGSESIVASNIVSILCVPLVIRNQLAGAIYVDHLETRNLFGKKDLSFLLAFADQAAIAIDNARLYGRLEARRRQLTAENESLRQEILSSRHLGTIIGKSAAMTHLKETLERIAASSSTVLVRGESGTGKGLVARTLHSISSRRDRPFVHFNCAALPETLVESELFGHEKGAFTGAVGQKRGRFELAHEGTIFLDEIGKISRSVQAKLLRVVEDREFERVGGTRTIKADVRVIAATNLNLEEAMARDEFREDLYYRLNIIPVMMPPLRERRDDIPFLVDHFLEKICRDLGQDRREVDPAVIRLFTGHRWPGNVRELEATIHRALVLSGAERLTVADFPWIAGDAAQSFSPTVVESAPPAPSLEQGSYRERSEAYDRSLIVEALEQCGGRIREASRALGIARNTLKAKMKKYGLRARD